MWWCKEIAAFLFKKFYLLILSLFSSPIILFNGYVSHFNCLQKNCGCVYSVHSFNHFTSNISNKSHFIHTVFQLKYIIFDFILI